MGSALKTIKYYLDVGCFFVKLVIQAQLEYPAFLVGWFFSNAIQFAVGLGTLKFLMSNFQQINGWEFNEIAFMYGIGIISHALSVILFIQTWGIEDYVTEGEFDRMLLRPMNVYYQFSVNYVNLIGLTDMLPGLIIFAYGAVAAGFSFSLLNIIRLLLVITGATLLRGSIFTIIGSIAFWTKRSRGLVDVNLSLLDRVIMYPTTIFGNVLQNIFTFIIPLAFISFYPASQFLNKQTVQGINIYGDISLITFGIGILFMVLAVGVFNLGMRRYDSAGS